MLVDYWEIKVALCTENYIVHSTKTERNVSWVCNGDLEIGGLRGEVERGTCLLCRNEEKSFA